MNIYAELNLSCIHLHTHIALKLAYIHTYRVKSKVTYIHTHVLYIYTHIKQKLRKYEEREKQCVLGEMKLLSPSLIPMLYT